MLGPGKAPVLPPRPATDLGGKDAKTSLNLFLQRFCQRPVTKTDMVYTVQKQYGQFQAVLALPCIEGSPEFMGGLGSTAKDAEKLAAEQALEAFANEIANLPPSKTQLKQQERAAQAAAGSEAAQAVAASEAAQAVAV